jgi:hypothetical protein
MGGRGSGNHHHWWRGGKKDTVEHCRQIEMNRWTREGGLKAGVWHSGKWIWFRDADTKEQAESIGFEVNTLGNEPWLRLLYTLAGTGEQVDYRVQLLTTRPGWVGSAGGSSVHWSSTAGRVSVRSGSCTYPQVAAISVVGTVTS